MVEAKHEFIDDNPYLVYSPDAEATASGSGGAGFPVVEASADTGALSVTAGELAELLNKNMVLIKPVSEDEYIWAIISGYVISENKYIFPSLVVGVTGAEAAPYKADTIDDYPEPFVIGG